MSKQREDETLQGGIYDIPEDKKVGFIIDILDRGPANMRLDTSFLPPDVYGEYASDDPNTRAYYELLGFHVDEQYSLMPEHAHLHSDGSGKAKVGDAVLYVCPRDHYALIEKAKNIRFERENKRGKDLPEDKQAKRDFASTQVDVDVKSNQNIIGGHELANILNTPAVPVQDTVTMAPVPQGG